MEQVDAESETIFVGQRCAYTIGSDQYAYQVSQVVGKSEIVAVPHPCVSYGRPRSFTRRRNGAWVEKGKPAGNGGRLWFTGDDVDTHIDPSF